jgi:hypothetical protein
VCERVPVQWRRVHSVFFLVAALVLLSTNYAAGAEPVAQAQPLGRPKAPAFGNAPTPAEKTASEAATSAQPGGVEIHQSDHSADFGSLVCPEIRSAAAANNLPAGFLTKLIWQESRFIPTAVSQAGAQGIAQFMPATARWRGLTNPFDPYWSIRESARWLGELRAQFGNLGLAAAAYNAGPRRIEDWLSGKRGLPRETKAYVRIVTGLAAEEWTRPGLRNNDGFVTAPTDCQNLSLSVLGLRLPSPKIKGPPANREAVSLAQKWSLQLIGDASETRALAAYGSLRNKFPGILGSRPPVVIKRQLGGRSRAFWYQIRIAENSRERADVLCSELKSAGGRCLVLRY